MRRESGLGGFGDTDSRRLRGPFSAAVGQVAGAELGAVGSGPMRSNRCGKGPKEGIIERRAPKLLVPQEWHGMCSHSSSRTVSCIKLDKTKPSKKIWPVYTASRPWS